MTALGKRPEDERIAEVLRAAGIDWHRANNPLWRDKPWTDGIQMDLDEDDQVGFLARRLLAELPLIIAPEESA